MPAIRYKHNYRNIELTDRGALHQAGVSGNNIAALAKNGEYILRRFGGFLPYDLDTRQHQLVKLVNLFAFTLDDDGLTDWQDIKSNHYCVGCVIHDTYYLLLENDFPVTHHLPPKAEAITLE